MKTKISMLIAAAVLLISCDLNKMPLSQLSPDSFFSNETELQAFSNQFYTIFPATGVYEEESDMLIKDGLTNEMESARPVPSSGGGWSFTDLRNYNTLIEYSVNCKDEAVRTKYIALARFFRAYYYFDKVKKFGDYPYYDKQMGSDDPDLYKPRDSREFVMTKILEDLDFAINNLTSDHDLYRVTKWTALALKSRVCLFEGTFRKYHAGKNVLATLPADAKPYTYYLELAVEASEEFINTSGYGLYTGGGKQNSYRDLFVGEVTSGDAFPEEVILARDYDQGLGTTHNGTYYTLGNYGNPSMTRKMACTYLMADGTRFTDKEGWDKMLFSEETKGRDPRMAQSIRIGEYKRVGSNQVQAPNFNNTITGYQPTKWMQSVVLDIDRYGAAFNDLPIFRTAEIYLNFAEALAELEDKGTRQITQSDLDKSVNKLRDRVGMPGMNLMEANQNPDPYLMAEDTGYPNVTGPNKGIILEIRRERSVEFFMENFRYYDLIRWRNGQAFTHPYLGIYIPEPGIYDLNGDGTQDVCFYPKGNEPKDLDEGIYKVEIDVKAYLTEGDHGYILTNKNTPGKWDEDKDYLYPIPTKEITLTGGVITQNPGW